MDRSRSSSGLQTVPPGKVTATDAGGPMLLSHGSNDAFIAVNRLLAAGREVQWLQSGHGLTSTSPQASSFRADLREDRGGRRRQLRAGAARPESVGRPSSCASCASGWPIRYGGSMPSGWTRLILEQFEFPFEVVYPKALDAGNLSAKYDVIIFPSGVGPAPAGRPWWRSRRPVAGGGGGRRGGTIPAEYQDSAGCVLGGGDDAGAEEVPRGGRHDPRRWAARR